MTLKEQLFNQDTISMLASRIAAIDESFDKNGFVRDCMNGLSELELKARMSQVREMLYKHLPRDFETVLGLFYKAFQSIEETHFVYGAVLEYIEVYGCTDEYVDRSLEALGDLTHILSSEFAIRPFIDRYPEKALKFAKQWMLSPNVHQRRLASEGTRPLLPWGGKVDLDYHETEPILDTLYDDPEDYVVRSVANHLNDISKVDPIYVINKLKQWKQSNSISKSTISYIDQHSLRTLLKQGNSDAMEFLGYPSNPPINSMDFRLLTPVITIGDRLMFEVDVAVSEPTRLMIDFTIEYPTKHNKTSKKVYKWKKSTLEAAKTYTFKGTRSFKDMSTRTHYPGQHNITIQINGSMWKTEGFTVKK